MFDFDEILIIYVKFFKEDNGSGPESLGASVRELWGEREGQNPLKNLDISDFDDI